MSEKYGGIIYGQSKINMHELDFEGTNVNHAYKPVGNGHTRNADYIAGSSS